MPIYGKFSFVEFKHSSPPLLNLPTLLLTTSYFYCCLDKRSPFFKSSFVFVGHFYITFIPVNYYEKNVFGVSYCLSAKKRKRKSEKNMGKKYGVVITLAKTFS